MTEMPKSYDHKATEAGWYARWDEAGLFTANARSPKPKYTICLPPPNITGELHMGHALNHSLQDFCSRYRRMSGYEVLFLPGMDHAAIATQNVIEKQLAAEGMTKEQLGREAFESRVNEWYVEVGDTIVRQDRILGASLDWTRLRFTMDERYVRSVMTAFVAFYERGWIYRAPRIVNWCPHDQSAISDLEVKWEEHHDTLYYIRYPIEGGGEVVIATVRPETMLADTAVAVNPTDPRYRSIVGKTAILPLVGRKLPIVADEAVEKDFGTGALKVTPGHDQMDYEIGQRHHLEIVNGMHPDGRMNVPGLPYDGLPALEARQLVVRDLKSQGYVVKEEPYTHEVGHCDRCDAIIEPLISEQWWLRMDKMRDKALGASAEGKVRWHPERYERTYLDWLHGLRDWNIGRQLWLGHRVPVYNCENGHRTVAVERPAECTECGSRQLTQDPDVLDTWFSSALWPFATLGWPDETEDLRAFYPNDMNSTAREIINLWVSRMIMTGLEFMGEVPFSDVAIHCQVQAADGRRMSKSLGTGLDPRRLITKYGADAVRAWAASVAMSSQDVRFDESRVEGYRRFCNKLWNAERLVLGNIGDGAVPAIPEADELELIEDRWILSRLASAQREVTDGIEGFEFQDSINAAYGCTWNELCDWWLEAAKDRLKDGDKTAQAVAIFCLDNLLRLLHPFMPFVTEDLWSRLPGERDFIMRAQWPEDLHRYVDGQAEVEFERLMDTVNEIRSYRKTIAGAPAKGGAVKLFEPAPPDWVRALTLLGSVAAVDELPPGKSFGLSAGSIVFPAIAAADPMIAAKKKAELQKELDRVQAKLDNPEFRAKAPESVIAEQQSRADELRAAIDRLE
ncbi:MAG: valine--tRNA ligase [Chloroflexi bacterium 13_1_40CM_65_17]|nr:MAG: valine--tRNA ligase [Chloroflexi bacterium 13_1_40CM_65_17]